MEMFSEKMKIWEDLTSKTLSKFEEKINSNDVITETLKMQTKNKVVIFEEQMNKMTQSLTSNVQKLNETDITRDGEFKAMQTTFLQDQEKFNHFTTTLLKTSKQFPMRPCKT